MSKYYVFCEITDDQPNVLAKWGVSGFPTVLVINKDSQIIHKMLNRSLDPFVKELDQVRQQAGL